MGLAAALAQGDSPARVGVLVLGSSDQRDDVDRQLLQGLNELGCVEGQRIPIVMVAVADPVGSAFVKSLAHPGTPGRSRQSNDIVAKMLSLFLRSAPRAARIAVLVNVNVNNMAHEPLWREAAQAVLALKVDARRDELRSAENPHGEDLPSAFERLSAAGARGCSKALTLPRCRWSSRRASSWCST